MPGALPHPPPVLRGQIRQRVCEGRRREEEEEEEVDRDHVSVPSVPLFPSPSAAQTLYNGIGQYSSLIQTYKIKQLPRVICSCSCLTPHGLPPADPRGLVQV